MWQNNNNSGLDGDIAETIIFDRLLNSAERNIVTSYLSAKFDVTVTGDQYTGDDPANDDNDLYVVGIGTESDGSNTCANSVGMIMEQSANYGNGDYLMWGTNEDLNDVNFADANDITGMLEARWERDWWLDITDAGGTIETDIKFDFSDANNMGFPDGFPSCYYLIHRTMDSGNWTILEIADAVVGDQVHFNDITLTADGYYTLGTCNPIGSPLPITLVSYQASVVNSESVKLEWITKSEHNNAFFTVEHSVDGKSWTKLEDVPGAGNSSKTLSYELFDHNPPSGISYYRLSQTDFDGTRTNIGTRSVNFQQEELIAIFPNPSNGNINLSFDLENHSNLEIVVYALTGQAIYSEKLDESKGHKLITLDLSSLSKGSYLLKINSTDGTYYEPVRIELVE